MGSIITDESSKPEILSRITQTTAALTRLKPVWNDRFISLSSNIRLMRSLVTSIFLYACEPWTLTAELQRRMQAMEMRRCRKILHISYKDHVTTTSIQMLKNKIKNLVCAFVVSKLDYCNSLLSCCLNHLLNKLQKVQHYAARLVLKAKKQEHIKSRFQNLHWLPVHSRIQCKISTLCHNSFSEFYELSLSELFTVYYPFRQLRSVLDTQTFRIPLTKNKNVWRTSLFFHRPETVELIAVWCPSLTILIFFQMNKHTPLPYMCVSARVSVCACVSVCLHIFVFVCMCVCVCVCGFFFFFIQ